MPTKTLGFEDLRKQIRSRKDLAPIYLLHGEEGYYIDVLVKDFENYVIDEADRDFNQYVFYAPRTELSQVMEVCNKLPLFSDRQLVVLKECQAANALQIDVLHNYVNHPNPSTVFVMAFRGEKAKGRNLTAAIKKANSVTFESKKITESSAPTLIARSLKEKGLNPDDKAITMLFDHIGTDLSRLYNEIDKLATILPQGATVTPEVVERNVGVSKDFNTFELVDAVARRDAKLVFRIAEYFRANPKASANVLNSAMLYSFFSDVTVAHFAKDKTDRGLMDALNAKNTWALRRVRTGMASYNAWQTIEIIDALRRFDAMSKGQGSRMNEHDLFRDLLFHILTARGILPVS